MLPDRVSNPGSLTYESGALPIALRGPAIFAMWLRYFSYTNFCFFCVCVFFFFFFFGFFAYFGRNFSNTGYY